MLKPSDQAPVFTLASTRGKSIALADLRGKKVILYFYPKDDTPGCTVEACGFRDHSAAAKAAGAVVLGVSKDSLEAHAKFREKYDLPFDLLSDPDNKVAKAYGAYGEKNMYGKLTMGTIRSTFVIDENGVVQAVWRKFKVDGHVEKVLASLSGAPGDTKKTAVKKAVAKKAVVKKAVVRKAVEDKAKTTTKKTTAKTTSKTTTKKKAG